MLNLEQFAADFARLHASYERQGYVLIKRALDRQAKDITAYVQENGIQMLSLVLPSLINTEALREAYVQLYTEIGVRHARNYSRLLDRILKAQKHGLPLMETKLVGFSSEFWRNIMADFFRTEAAGRVTEVDATTIRRIREVMANAQEQNLTLTQQARYLTEQLNDLRFNATRSMLIARTESTTAANVVGQRVAQEAEFLLNKIWVAALDSRTRNSHKKVSQSGAIEMDMMFEVPNAMGGIEYARYPGDSSLSVGNVANCRCIVAHVPVLDEDGLPIPK